MLLDLDQLFDYLSGFNSEACQQIGIETGKKIRHFTVFFRPLGEKHCLGKLCENTDFQER